MQVGGGSHDRASVQCRGEADDRDGLPVRRSEWGGLPRAPGVRRDRVPVAGPLPRGRVECPRRGHPVEAGGPPGAGERAPPGRRGRAHPGERRLKKGVSRERRLVAVTEMVGRGIAVSRACPLGGTPRGTRYSEPRPRASRPFNPGIRTLVLETAEERPSFGYRRVTAMVRRRLRVAVNEKAVRRILRAEDLQLPPCVVPRHRVRKHPGRQITERPGVAWQLDMKHVWCGRDGWAYLQNVADTCTAEWLGYVFAKRCGSREADGLPDRVGHERVPQA